MVKQPLQTRFNFGLTVLFVCFCQACVNPVELPVREAARDLIVEGFITNQPGPHTVRLTKAARYEPFSELSGVISAVLFAEVFIRSGAGEVIPLTELGAGHYQTPPEFRGRIGETYTLHINTLDDEQYVSTPERLPAGPEIEEILLRFEEKPSNEIPISGVNVFVAFTDNPDERDFYLGYTSEGVYPWTSHPELALQFGSPCPANEKFRRCFRYERDYFQPSFRRLTSADCYTREFNPFDFRLADDRFQNGKRITALAAFIPDDGRRFEYSYKVKINFLAISAKAYGFYNRLVSQLSIEGDIFDPPPASILGNMLSLGDNQNPALGFFGAYYEDAEEVYIENDILEFRQAKLQFGGNCINLDSSVVDKPDWWQGSSW